MILGRPSGSPKANHKGSSVAIKWAQPLWVNQNQLCHLLQLFYMNGPQDLISPFLSPYHIHTIVIYVYILMDTIGKVLFCKGRDVVCILY